MKINFYISLLCYAILFNIMNPMFNYYYLIFTTYLLWVFSVATTSRYVLRYGKMHNSVSCKTRFVYGDTEKTYHVRYGIVHFSVSQNVSRRISQYTKRIFQYKK